MNLPQDRRLIQESLEQVSKGPQALLAWAQEHSKEIDQKFMNQLHRMVEYCEKNNQEQLAKTFTFLEQCFNKMFGISATPMAIAITKESFKDNFNQACELLSLGKASASLGLLQALSIFLAQSPIVNASALVTANMGIAYSQLKKHDEAIQYFQRALSEEIGDIAKEKILANLAMTYRQKQNYEESIRHYQLALEMAQKRSNQEMEFVLLNNLALVYLDKKDLEKAIEHQQKAHTIAQTLGKPKVVQDSLARLAVLHALQGNSEKCQEFCKQGLDIEPPAPQKTSDYLNLGLE